MVESNPNYVFYRSDGGLLACDIRMPSEGPERSRKIAPHALIRLPAIKEMAAEHRKIIMQMVMHCSERSLHNLLQDRQGFDLAKSIIMTGRGYWLKEASKPIAWSTPCQATLTWTTREDKLFSPILSIPDRPDFLIPLIPPLGLFASAALARPVTAAVSDASVGEWSVPRPPMEYQAALDFCRVLGARDPHVVLPLPPNKGAPVKLNVAPVPRLLITTKSIHGSTPDSEDQLIPVARLAFDYGVERLLPSDTRKSMVTTQDDLLIECDRDRVAEARTLEQMRTMGFKPLEEIDPLAAC